MEISEVEPGGHVMRIERSPSDWAYVPSAIAAAATMVVVVVGIVLTKDSNWVYGLLGLILAYWMFPSKLVETDEPFVEDEVEEDEPKDDIEYAVTIQIQCPTPQIAQETCSIYLEQSTEHPSIPLEGSPIILNDVSMGDRTIRGTIEKVDEAITADDGCRHFLVSVRMNDVNDYKLLAGDTDWVVVRPSTTNPAPASI